jgi:flagellar biosynthesis protein FlhB
MAGACAAGCAGTGRDRDGPVKSEKPTPRRLLKESKKGKSFTSRDLTIVAMLVPGLFVLAFLTSLTPVSNLYAAVIARDFTLAPAEAAVMAVKAFAYAAAPMAVVCVLGAMVSSFAQSKGVIATEAIRIDLNRINPVSGFRNLFSLRVVKDLVRATLYTVLAALFVVTAWKLFAPEIFSQVHMPPRQLAAVWRDVAFDAAIGLMLALAPIYLLCGFIDYKLHVRELKMEKFEVKQERKENEGNPEIKRRRRDIHVELSGQVQADVAGSSVILANPTHIAVGIYLHSTEIPMPLVSVREQGQRARAVIALAEKLGVPVVRDIPVARAVYARSKRYRFLDAELIEPVVRILLWLRDVERAGAETPARADEVPSVGSDKDAPDPDEPAGEKTP